MHLRVMPIETSKIFRMEHFGVNFVFLLILKIAASGTGNAVSKSQCYCAMEELSGLRSPVHVEQIKGTNSYLIAEQMGHILKYSPNADAANKLKTYVDLADKVVCEPKLFEERGLLGFTQHPEFSANKKLYTYSVRQYNGKEHVVISEITDGHVEQEKIILVIEQPGNRRNGGQLLFGQDGYLYIFIGDGGPQNDSRTEAQNVGSLLGKVLRIDVSSTVVSDYRLRFYDIPASNPQKPGWRPEIYALGSRNMWRCSEDRGDKNGNGKGRIFCGDLGSGTADELNIITKGGNYGWHYREGLTCINPSKCGTIENEILPIYAFNRSTSGINAIIGGPLYRGSSFPDAAGQLMYGDFLTGDLFTLKQNGDTWTPSSFTPCDHRICGCHARTYRRSNLLSFGQTEDDEVLLLMTDDLNPANPRGALLKLVPPVGTKPVTCGSSGIHRDVWLIVCMLCFVQAAFRYFNEV